MTPEKACKEQQFPEKSIQKPFDGEIKEILRILIVHTKYEGWKQKSLRLAHICFGSYEKKE